MGKLNGSYHGQFVNLFKYKHILNSYKIHEMSLKTICLGEKCNMLRLKNNIIFTMKISLGNKQ